MFRKLSLLLCAVAGATILASALHAQVARSVVGTQPRLWVGGEYSYFRPDWGTHDLPGIGIYADLHVVRRYGLEAEARFLTLTKPQGLTEKSYLVGPYGRLYQWHHFTANAKFLGGVGVVNYPYSPSTYGHAYGSYLEFAPGGNVEYRLSQRLKARLDYEYQFMPMAPGLPFVPQHGLTPNGYSGGVSYRVF